MDLPRTSLMGEDVCDANRGGRLHPIGLACPRCRRADAGPPPRPPHPAGLPLRPLWAAVQGLHRHGPVRHDAARQAGTPGVPHSPAGRGAATR